MRFLVTRRSLLLVPAAIAAMALPVAPAFAGEDPGGSGGSGAPNYAQLRSSQCVSATRVKATVAGTNITSVKFYVDGKLIKTVSSPASSGRYVFSMKCSRLTVGAHRARALVSYSNGATQSMRFQITRSRQASPRFTG
jgi:hypothetical protein